MRLNVKCIDYEAYRHKHQNDFECTRRTFFSFWKVHYHSVTASELGLHCLRMSVLWYAGLELVDEVNSGLDHVSACSAGSRLISYEDITRFNIFTMHLTLSTLTTNDISVFCLAFPTEWGSWRAMQVVSKGGGWHGVSGAILWNREILPICRLLN